MDLEALTPRPCYIAAGLETLGERWSLLALRELVLGVHRFDAIVRNTGASRDILADRLRSLERDGVIERVAYSERPPRFEYHLTESGREVAPILIALAAWGSRWRQDETPRLAYAHSCGALLAPRVHCAECGEVMDAESIGPGRFTSSLAH